jgi:glutaredoxin
MKTMLRWMSVLLLAAALPAAAQYRWQDANGRTNYGDVPPADAKNLVQLDSRSGGEDSNAGLPFEVRRAMSQFPVTLYTADACPPCEEARVHLRRRGVPFAEVMVETDLEGAELKRRTGTDSVPVMTLGRLPHIGFQAKAWTAALDAAGYPAQFSLPPTYRSEPPRMLLPRAEANADRATPRQTQSR